jgi:hypothetical protein
MGEFRSNSERNSPIVGPARVGLPPHVPAVPMTLEPSHSAGRFIDGARPALGAALRSVAVAALPWKADECGT